MLGTKTVGLSPPRLSRHAGTTAAVLLVLAACLMVSGQAFASVVRLDFVDDARVEYLAAAGEVNVVTIARSGSTYTVTDSAPLTAGSGCTQVSPGRRRVPRPGCAV